MAEAILTARDVSPEAEDEGSSRVKSKLQGRNLATSSSINDTYPSSNSPVFLMMASGQIESAEGLAEGITQTTRRSRHYCRNFVWNFPIDITFKSTNPYGWPQIVMSVYGLNTMGRDEVRGYGVTHLPITSGNHILEVPLFVPQSGSPLQRFLSLVIGRKPEYVDPQFIAQGKGRDITRTQSQGHMKLNLNIVTKDLWEHGYRNGTISRKNISHYYVSAVFRWLLRTAIGLKRKQGKVKMAAEVDAEFVRSVYSYTGEGQAVPLPFAESTVLLVAEKTQDGWCRGFAAGKEGWFPITYVKPLGNSELLQKGILPSSLALLMYSDLWKAHITNDNKIYYVNTENQGTTWELPPVKLTSTDIPSSEPSLARTSRRTSSAKKSKKPKYSVINGITFLENGEEQPRLHPSEISYVDHFWSDNGDQAGFDIILEKHLNGKESMKDMIDFFRERAVLEEQYSKGLLKLSKSTLGDQEQGTLGKAWQGLKAELRRRSESHTKFVEKLQKEMEKPLFEFKESQKKIRKEHQQIMERSRKQVVALDTSLEKLKGVPSGKSKLLRKGNSLYDPQISLRKRASVTGDEMKKLEESYNQMQQQWVDNMISACQDYESQEGERYSFLQCHLFKYADLCVVVDEASAESLSLVTDGIDRINIRADREHFIKLNGTGTARPVDRVFNT